MADKEFTREQKRVEEVIRVIESHLKKLEEKAGDLRKDVISLRKNFWDDVTVNLDDPDDIIETHASLKQQAEFLAERERSHGIFRRQWRKLTRAKDSPYFGRIDFIEDGKEDAEEVYIGLSSVLDEEEERFLVYDWRTPIASMYYDYAPGPAQYETMDGIIRGEMTLKRQYLIRKGVLQGFFDTGMTIGDELLQQVLSGKASAEMKSIVATIQAEQNRIIRHEKTKHLIVLGVAGSGKTSAALQRVAYLLYRHRNQLRSENILLFSPNPMFNHYVSAVLPELGEENMQQTTFYQYASFRLGKLFKLEHPYTQIEYMLRSTRNVDYQIRKLSIQVKASLLFKELLDRYIAYLHKEGMPFRNIVFREKVIIPAQEITQYFYQLDSGMTIANRLERVKEWLLERLKKLAEEERTKEWVEEESELLSTAEYTRIYRQLQRERRFTENTFDDFSREQRMIANYIIQRRIQPLVKKISSLKFVHIPKLYEQFFNWAKGTNMVPEKWEAISQQTIAAVKKRYLYYEDITPLLYLLDHIFGKHFYPSIRYLFIDEAQDYTPFQLAYFRSIFPNSRMTLLGDLNQSIFTHALSGEAGLSRIERLFPDAETETIVLTKSYRSTKEIVEFTSRLLGRDIVIEPFQRHGPKPVLMQVDTEEELLQRICEKIKEFQGRGHESIAIICKTQLEANRVHGNLKEHLPVHLIRKETNQFVKGVTVIPSYLAKGIEFDAVIVYNCSEKVYKYEDERFLLYTVCTRAMHELQLFTIGKESPLLKIVPDDLYDK